MPGQALQGDPEHDVGSMKLGHLRRCLHNCLFEQVQTSKGPIVEKWQSNKRQLALGAGPVQQEGKAGSGVYRQAGNRVRWRKAAIQGRGMQLTLLAKWTFTSGPAEALAD